MIIDDSASSDSPASKDEDDNEEEDELEADPHGGTDPFTLWSHRSYREGARRAPEETQGRKLLNEMKGGNSQKERKAQAKRLRQQKRREEQTWLKAPRGHDRSTLPQRHTKTKEIVKGARPREQPKGPVDPLPHSPRSSLSLLSSLAPMTMNRPHDGPPTPP